MSTMWAFIKRDFLTATSYKAAFTLQLVRIVAAVPFFFYISRVVGETGASALAKYGGNYFAFLLIGIAFLDYLGISLRSFNQNLRDSQVMGTLEIMLLSPTSLVELLSYSSAWVYLFATIRFALYLLVGLVFGLELGNSNLPAAMLVLFLAVVSLASFGILSASVTMVIKQGEFLNTALSMASTFCGGVLFPVTVLPPWLQTVSKFIPTTHALEGMRLALFQGYSFGQLGPQVGILLIFIVVLLPASLFSFWWSVRWTKRTGTLAQY